MVNTRPDCSLNYLQTDDSHGLWFTVLNNPSEDEGLLFSSLPPVTNGPGTDLVLFVPMEPIQTPFVYREDERAIDLNLQHHFQAGDRQQF